MLPSSEELTTFITHVQSHLSVIIMVIKVTMGATLLATVSMER